MTAQIALPATVYAHPNVQTSREAARIASGHATEQAARVLNVIRDAGEAGVTRTEIAVRLGMLIQTVTPRVFALVEAGLAYERGTRDGGKVVRAVAS